MGSSQCTIDVHVSSVTDLYSGIFAKVFIYRRSLATQLSSSRKLMMHGTLAVSNAHLFLIFDLVAWFQLYVHSTSITLEA